MSTLDSYPLLEGVLKNNHQPSLLEPGEKLHSQSTGSPGRATIQEIHISLKRGFSSRPPFRNCGFSDVLFFHNSCEMWICMTKQTTRNNHVHTATEVTRARPGVMMKPREAKNTFGRVSSSGDGIKACTVALHVFVRVVCGIFCLSRMCTSTQKNETLKHFALICSMQCEAALRFRVFI